MRTISEPACASSLTWIAVPIGSSVSVLVMDCTRTGASPPTVTTREPQATLAWTERRAGRAAGVVGRPGGGARGYVDRPEGPRRPGHGAPGRRAGPHPPPRAGRASPG